jgi:putative membrane protein
MIAYNPKEWFSFIFRFHKADTFRKLLPLMGAVALYSGLVAWLELEYWQLSDQSVVRNITITHSMLGFVISLLLVFRTNTAYDRWWEGRKLWGALVNSSRNLAIKFSALVEDESDRRWLAQSIGNYAKALSAHLQRESTRLTLFEDFHPELDTGGHVPNQIARLLYQRVRNIHVRGDIDGFDFLALQAEMQAFTDICGACERIKNTPIPWSYSAFIKKFIFFYVMTLPLGYVFSLGYLVIPVVVFILYVLASLELIAEEIEDPFGTDTNDLPTGRLAEMIADQAETLLRKA